jgi:hypothetical protein
MVAQPLANEGVGILGLLSRSDLSGSDSPNLQKVC